MNAIVRASIMHRAQRHELSLPRLLNRELSSILGVYTAVGSQISSKEINATINVTPMIDILLVLLIVFMLLPVHSHGLESDLPQPAQPGAPSANPQQVIVRIAKDGSLQIDARPILPAELEARLQSLFAARPDGVLFVDA